MSEGMKQALEDARVEVAKRKEPPADCWMKLAKEFGNDDNLELEKWQIRILARLLEERCGAAKDWILNNGRHTIMCASRTIKHKSEASKAPDDSRCDCGLTSARAALEKMEGR